MKRARIYQRPKKATQSGKAFAGEWILDFGKSSPRRNDPLTGWVGSKDTSSQVTLRFATAQDAIDYANRHSIPYDLEKPPAHRLVPNVYENNYHSNRRMNWTH